MAWRDYLPWGRTASTIDLLNAGQPPVPRTPPIPPRTGGDEFGVAGTENFGGYIRGDDFNPELDDFQRAVKIYDKMRRTDAQLRAMLQVIKLPLRGATWAAIPPSGGDPVDKQIAAFVNQSLFDDDAMDDPWDYTLRHILMQLDFGFSVLEKVWRVDDDGFYRLRRLAPRLPKTIREWHVERNGKLKAVVQYAPVPKPTERPANTPARVRYDTTVSFEYITIPANYLCVFSLEREGDNYEGWSVLRTVYRNWWYKDQAYRLEGVRLDRYGVGIPVAELDLEHGLTPKQLEKLADVLKAIRANEKAFIVAPPHVRFRILPEGGQGGVHGADKWIEHHDSQIARNVLAGFLQMGRDPRGTLGFGSRLTDLFISSLSGVAAGIAGDLKQQVVRQLCDLNFDMTKREYPSVIVQDLESVDLDNLIKVLGDLGGQYLTPDDDTETLLRKILKLPDLRQEDTRKAKAEKAETDAAAQKEAAAEAAAREAAAAGEDPEKAAAEARAGGALPNKDDVAAKVDELATQVQKMADREPQPIHVEVHPSPVTVHPPNVEMHLKLPKLGPVKKVVEYDTDPKSPTYGQVKSTREEPIEGGDGD